MGSFRLRQGQQPQRLAGISWRTTVLGLVLGFVLLSAAPSAASAAADLSVNSPGSVTATPEPVRVGEQLTYTITVQNIGADPATAVGLTDELALGLSLVSVIPSQGTCSNTSPVQCNLGTIEGQASATVTIVADVTAQTPSSIVNSASVSSPEDAILDNNDSPEVVTTVVPVANLMVTMTAVPDPVTAGDLLTYTLVVKNRGPSTATTVAVTDTLPAGVDFVAASTGCAEASGEVTCDVGTLTIGQSSTLDITVRPQSAGSLTNQAAVASAVTDPDSADNSASVDVTVSSPVIGGGGSGDGGPKTGPLDVVLTGSYVLISGRSVKLVKGKFVPVRLTCAGQRKCEGAITISTAKPVTSTKKPKKGKKRKRRVARLGSKRFAIESNRQQKVLVPLSKSKIKLLKRLKRVKAKAAIREVDLKGNPRISTRTFMLRAR